MISSKLKARILFAKYRVWRPDAISYYHVLLRNERLSADELGAMNWNKAKALLAYAYEKVPFYRRKFTAAGLHPNDVIRREDYQRVPRLTKEELRSNFAELVSVDAKSSILRVSATGGSTGIPVKVLVDKRIPHEAHAWRAMRWWGLTPGVDTAFVWRLIRRQPIGRILYSAAHWPTRSIFLDASCMKEEAMEDFVRRFNKVCPPLLQGYVGGIYELALYIEANRMPVCPPKAIWVTSSPITTSQRHRIETVFGAPVHDQYGSGEASWLAAQCEQRGGLHIFHDARLIEFVDDTGRSRPIGQSGRVLITNLENYLFPIIRYENGDMGRALVGTCPCGRNLPLMGPVTGRTTDVIRLPGGACIAGDYLTTIFDNHPGVIKAFQVRQGSDYSIRVIYVPDSSGRVLTEALEKVRLELMRNTASKVSISFESVTRIPHDRGKLRFVLTDVGQAEHAM